MPGLRPTKISALSAWPIGYSTPLWMTDGNGLPAAINARPPDPGDQVADPGSECEVGLDNAKPVHGDRR